MPIHDHVEALLLVGTLVLSVIVALGVSRILLATLLALMSGATLPFAFHWKRVAFASALFWFWYLTPVLAASNTAARLFHLFSR